MQETTRKRKSRGRREGRVDWMKFCGTFRSTLDGWLGIFLSMQFASEWFAIFQI